MKLDFDIVLNETASRGGCAVVEHITVDNIDKALETLRSQFEKYEDPINDCIYYLELRIINPESF